MSQVNNDFEQNNPELQKRDQRETPSCDIVAARLVPILQFGFQSPRTLKRLAYNGHLPFSKIGHTVRRLMEIIENGINTNREAGRKREAKSLSARYQRPFRNLPKITHFLSANSPHN